MHQLRNFSLKSSGENTWDFDSIFRICCNTITIDWEIDWFLFRSIFHNHYWFEICLFLFDIHSNLSLNNYNQFKAVNPRNHSADSLRKLNAKPFVETINGVDEIIAISWRIDNPAHHIHIHEMFLHILEGRA